MRRALVLLGGAAVVAVAVHFSHGFQVRRQASTLLAHAQRNEDQEERGQAARYLTQYLTLVPEDHAAVARLALLSAKSAASPRAKQDAAMRCDRALRQDSSRDDVRRELARLWMELGRFSDAVERAKELRESDPSDAEALRMLARAYVGQGKYADSALEYKALLKLEPADIDSAVVLTILYREKLGSPKNANAQMDAMIAANPQSVRAYLARFAYRMRFGTAEEADRDLDAAMKLAPTDDAVLLAASERATARGEFARAIELLETGQSEYPHDTRFQAQLGRTYLMQGEVDKVVEAFRRGLDEAPTDVGFLWRLALVHIEQKSLDEAEELVDRLQRASPNAPQLDFVRAAVLEAKGNVVQAAQLYEKATAALERLPDLQSLAHFRLAECFAALDQWDLALTAYRRATQIDPRGVSQRLGLGRALERLGRLDEAVKEYETLAGLASPPREVFVSVARARLAQVLRQPEDRRSWDKLDELFERVSQQAPDSIDIAILKAQSLLVRDRKEEAIKSAEAARDANRDQPAAWLGLAAIYRLAAASDKALDTLDQAVEELGDKISFRFARAGQVAASGNSGEARAILEQGIDQAEGAELTARLKALAQLALAQQDLPAARRYFDEWQRRRPEDTALRAAIADSSLAPPAGDSATRTADKAPPLAGSLASLGQFAKARELYLQRKDKPQALAEAKKILETLKTRRAQWPQLYVLLGAVEEALDDRDAAIKAYGSAQEFGDRSLEVARRHVQLLGLSGRYQEINPVLERLRLTPQPIDLLQRFAAEISLRAGNVDQGLKLAKEMVAAQPNDYRSHDWLGRLLWFAGKREDAEAAIKKATSLDPQATESWAALVQMFMLTDRAESALATIEEAKGVLAPEKALVAVPLYFELARKPEQTEQLFEASLAAHPENSQLQQLAADYFFRHANLKKAETCFRSAMELEPANNRVRQSLAWVIASQRSYATWNEAVALIDKNLASPDSNVVDKRVKSILLAMRPNSRNRTQAIKLLEELTVAGAATIEDRFRMAQLFFFDAQPAKGLELLATLEGREGIPMQLVGNCVETLLVHRELEAAKTWLEQLDKLAPESDGAAAMRARLLDLQREPENAVALLRKRLAAQKEPARAEVVLRDCVRVVYSFRWSEPAEAFYREIIGDRTDLFSNLALWLRNHGRVDAALDICRRADEEGKTELAALLGIAVIYDTDSAPDRLAAVEKWYAKAIKENPQSAELKFSEALLFHIRGQHDESVRRFQELLTKGADPMRVLNNMSWVVCEGLARPAEALPLIEQAVRQFGPVPSLLDTRGVILTRLARFDEAIADLEAATTDQRTVSRLFHLSAACFQGGKVEVARSVVEKLEATGPITSLRTEQQKELARIKDSARD